MDRPALHRLADLVPIALAIALLAEIVPAWIARVPHPYDLEWMEGGMLAHAWRLQHDLSLYPPPGPDFVSFVYPPGYTSLLAAIGAELGLGPTLGRSLALLGTLGAAGAIAFGVARHGGSAVVGCLAAVVFLGTWPASGAFFDLVRPDSLALCFLAWAIVTGLDRRRGAEVAAGLLLAAAWACKHNSAAFGVAMLLGIAVRDGWHRGIVFGLSAGLPALAISLFMQFVSEGRFLTYLLGVPASHPTALPRIWPGTPGELADALAIATTVASLYVIGRAADLLPWNEARPPGNRLLVLAGAAISAAFAVALGVGSTYPTGVMVPAPSELDVTFASLGGAVGAVIFGSMVPLRRRQLSWEWVYGVGIAGTGLVTAAIMRGHHGGFLNVHMPMHWVVVFSFGMAIARLRRTFPGPIVGTVTALLLGAQLGLQSQTLQADQLLPTPADVAAGDLVVERIRERCKGPVFSPYAAWLPAQAGLAPSAHLIAVWDINHERGPFNARMADFTAAARKGYWDCVVEGGKQRMGFDLSSGYRLADRLPVKGRELMPRTGWRVRPTELHVPK